MKLLFQHAHHLDEIAGVLTYISALEPEIQRHGVTTQTVSTKVTPLLQQIQAIAWADIVHMNSNNLAFLLWCKLLGKKVILKYHYLFYQTTHFVYEPMSFRQRLKAELIHALPKAHYPLKWKLHSLLKYARLATRLTTSWLVDRRLACSQFLAASYSLPWPIETLYNPAVISTQSPKSLNQLSYPYTFVYVGRLSSDKGVDLLLQATQQLSQSNLPFQVLIIGDGPSAQVLQTLSGELGIAERVQFLGACSHAEILPLMQSALALVVPSRWQEPAGYVALEAASVQTCAIVAQVGGLPEIATPYGLFFERENSPALAALMQACLANPTDSLVRGQKAYHYVLEHFPPAKIAHQLLAVCQALRPD
jgi:glycogen synthase